MILPRATALAPVSRIVVPARARHVATGATSPPLVRTTRVYLVTSSYVAPPRPVGGGAE